MYASDLKHNNPGLEDKLAQLYSLSRDKTIDLSFRPVYLDLLKKLGNPHRKLPPIIHVAGTNGKGSVIAILKSILEAGGYNVHAYTSPHLVNFNERIVLNNTPITDADLDILIDEVLTLNGNNEITFFEITTALAFAAFSRTPGDILLLETGLGGRLDCTNVIENPLATIIASIGFDHMDHLGKTIEKIAAEKAGIIKPNVPCILAPQNYKEAISVFEKTAAEKNAPLIGMDSVWFIEENKNEMVFSFNQEKHVLPLPNLQGKHQIANAGTALAALEILKKDFSFTNSSIEKGLTHISWPGRLQNITAHFKLPPGFEVWLDGAHNEDGARALSVFLKNDPRKTHLIFAMLRGKDPQKFLKILENDIASLHLVNIPNEPKALRPAEIENQLSNFTPPVHIYTNYEEAVKNIVCAQVPCRILIAGSLYLAGHVLKNLRP